MNHYKSIDPIILEWTAQNSLQLYTWYREGEVRTVDVVNRRGERCQLWIDRPQADGNVWVHVWDYKKRKEDLKATAQTLLLVLQQAHSIAVRWLE